MEKPCTILIPTDFSVGLLKLIRLALEKNQWQDCRLILLYSTYLPDAITDLLFYSDKAIYEENAGPEFREALEIIRNKYESRISAIEVLYLHHSSASLLQTMLEREKIDVICLPDAPVIKDRRMYFSPVKLLKKMPFKILELEWQSETDFGNEWQLITLFK